jgi:hypothetical protein
LHSFSIANLSNKVKPETKLVDKLIFPGRKFFKGTDIGRSYQSASAVNINLCASDRKRGTAEFESEIYDRTDRNVPIPVGSSSSLIHERANMLLLYCAEPGNVTADRLKTRRKYQRIQNIYLLSFSDTLHGS